MCLQQRTRWIKFHTMKLAKPAQMDQQSFCHLWIRTLFFSFELIVPTETHVEYETSLKYDYFTSLHKQN
jgi:hypothetical protein